MLRAERLAFARAQPMTVYRSPYPDVGIPDAAITDHVLAGLAGREQEAVFVDGPTGRAVTGAEFRARVAALAGGFAARGIGRGSVVALMAGNAPEFAVVFHGVARAGGTVTTINPAATAEEARRQMRDAGAHLAVAGAPLAPLAPLVRAAAEGIGVAEVVAIGQAEGTTPLPRSRPTRSDRYRSIRRAISPPCPIPRARRGCPRA
jgi:acyl-CoA synthetase (AMP-forming)/AMP-acid ligase II